MKIAKKSIRNFAVALRSRFSFSWNLYHPLPDQQLNPARQALVLTHLFFEDRWNQIWYQILHRQSLWVHCQSFPFTFLPTIFSNSSLSKVSTSMSFLETLSRSFLFSLINLTADL